MGRRRGGVGVLQPQITTESRHLSQRNPWALVAESLSAFPSLCPSLAADSREALAEIPLCPLLQELPWLSAPQYRLHIPAHKARARPHPVFSLTSHFSVSFFSVSLSKSSAEPPRLSPWPPASGAVTCHQCLSVGHHGAVELAADLQPCLRCEISLGCDISPRFEISLLWQWLHDTGLTAPLTCVFMWLCWRTAWSGLQTLTKCEVEKSWIKHFLNLQEAPS